MTTTKFTRYLLVFCLFLTSPLSAQEETPPETTEETSLTPEEQQYMEWAQGLWDSFELHTGEIEVANGAATLEVPEGFYFLDSEDAAKVLIEIWENPPETAQGVLGMLFPQEYTPFDAESWGVTIEYEKDGYVSDEDAADIDYDDMLKDMQADTRDASEARVQQGYVPIELVGWAEPPYYEADTHKLYWAKELRFGDNPVNTLNYNIRVLGRQGVLVMNFIASMDQLPQINSEREDVLAMANFNEGSRYADFNPDIDEVAAYGLGALVAGKVAAKAGLFAMALLVLKKFWFVILIAIGAVFKFFKRKSKTTEQE